MFLNKHGNINPAKQTTLNSLNLCHREKYYTGLPRKYETLMTQPPFHSPPSIALFCICRNIQKRFFSHSLSFFSLYSMVNEQ